MGQPKAVPTSQTPIEKVFAYILVSGYSNIVKEITTILKSLEDETRLRIMGLLLGTNELCVCHIIEVLELPQSTVSRHLATLKNAGWLKDRREGVWIHYSVNPDLGPTHKVLISALHTVLENNDMKRKDEKRLAALALLCKCR